MLNLSLRKKYFDAIRSGHKTVEGRLYSSKFKDLKPGMNISFTDADTNEVMICKVQAINIYPNFEAMLINEGLERMLPGVKNLQEGIAIYESFPGYKDNVKKIGALAIRIYLNSDC